ncbi:MAG: 2OG-Fe(II) oxygenase [Brumimicrobium sp.]|nr:2OG-Fe(II) oxygenase [Brumimicrobium sp.]
MEENDVWAERMDALALHDYVVMDDFLSEEILAETHHFFNVREALNVFDKAAIGSGRDEQIINEVRGDYTYWLDKKRDEQELRLFEVLDEVKRMINRYCFLSLSDYEFHLALYPKGSFYKKHLDQFRGRNNRMISMIIYLNKDWKPGDGGELKVYPEGKEAKTISPLENRCILFRSDTLLHEVLTANKSRKSVTGWMLYQPSILVGVTP